MLKQIELEVRKAFAHVQKFEYPNKAKTIFDHEERHTYTKFPQTPGKNAEGIAGQVIDFAITKHQEFESYGELKVIDIKNTEEESIIGCEEAYEISFVVHTKPLIERIKSKVQLPRVFPEAPTIVDDLKYQFVKQLDTRLVSEYTKLKESKKEFVCIEFVMCEEVSEDKYKEKVWVIIEAIEYALSELGMPLLKFLPFNITPSSEWYHDVTMYCVEDSIEEGKKRCRNICTMALKSTNHPLKGEQRWITSFNVPFSVFYLDQCLKQTATVLK